MSKVLVILETAGGQIRPHSLSGITCAAEIARATGKPLHLLVLGAHPDAAAQAIAAAGYGAAAVHTLAGPTLEPFTAEAWADAIVHAARTLGASVIGGTASSTLRDALPRAAAILDAPLVSEVVKVKSGDTFVRPISAGRALQDQKVNAGTFFFTARGTEFEHAQPTGAVPVQPLAPAAANTRGAVVQGVQKTESSRPQLTEAKVIVSGGRGMREGANFKVLEQLTDLLGGALGASRAATDAGMVPADLQVGQTGKIVAPELYFAVAISGAIQHLAGMKGSKTIVAINKDAEAPIFQVADYGLVGKWEEAVPRLVELIKARKGAA
ncbi:electron transfer flavoprotein alpha subunit apoprotein [Nannocystis exedens]|uniref:Electron transfer flavoprotein subunit alpha n=1 Tax=Nannocystis exedens TaxID=54 RepID=A0A1I1WKF2_9BACT|nr:FAD-binding protein [Nannocystis exedens]PCC67660.1 Electron transfer flavoprotein alpha and subunit beta [Nannocystis exedens]SFD93580.1 electron transfer flavoprotein alpha subunit apoprotein [Nannocystis exedens]